MAAGSLRIYLGAAPGVGKTYAMLNEGYRRSDRGADVVIGVAETHGASTPPSSSRDLEVIPLPRGRASRHACCARWTSTPSWPARPNVVLVDEFAHTNAPGSRHEKRWQDVEELLDAGIDVISTLNIQHLESLNDVIARITGVTQRETVPDAMVRAADQIELVDMSPEALRRRMAHGNIYPAERIDAALGNYFRPGNLGALRELALLWVAGRVEETLSSYLDAHGITEAWETRERVVVGITGAPGGDRLIRRAARMAGPGRRRPRRRARRRRRRARRRRRRRARRPAPARAASSVARCTRSSASRRPKPWSRSPAAEKATQLVLGRLAAQPLVRAVARLVLRRGVAGWLRHRHPRHRRPSTTRPATAVLAARARPPIERRRTTVAAWVADRRSGSPLTSSRRSLRDDLELSTVLLVFLALVVVVSALGGRLVAAVAAIVLLALVNWFLVPPHHTLTISEAENLVALVVFVAVAVTVGTLVDTPSPAAAPRRRIARAEAEALARSAAELAADPEPLPGLIEHAAHHVRARPACASPRPSDGADPSIAASGSH